MLTEIAVSGFRALHSATLSLEPPISVLLGPNNAGKSTALLIIDLLRELSGSQDLRAALAALQLAPSSLLSRGSPHCELKVTGDFEGSTIRYSLRFDARASENGLETIEATNPDFIVQRQPRTGGTPNYTGSLNLFSELGGLLNALNINQETLAHTGCCRAPRLMVRRTDWLMGIAGGGGIASCSVMPISERGGPATA